MSEELPKVHTEYNDGEIIDDIKNRAENAEFIDIRDTLTENKDKQIYYKTDHHWTSYGAYLAYKKWAESENIEVCSDYVLRVISRSGQDTAGDSRLRA